MYYLKTLFFNFLVVFFANHILPGIEVVSQTKLPHLGGDLGVAAALGFLNSLIYPLLKMMDQLTVSRILMSAILLNFAAYALLKLLPMGIQIQTVEGYLIGAGVVALGSILTNVLEMKHARPKREDPPSQQPPAEMK